MKYVRVEFKGVRVLKIDVDNKDTADSIIKSKYIDGDAEDFFVTAGENPVLDGVLDYRIIS